MHGHCDAKPSATFPIVQHIATRLSVASFFLLGDTCVSGLSTAILDGEVGESRTRDPIDRKCTIQMGALLCAEAQ